LDCDRLLRLQEVVGPKQQLPSRLRRRKVEMDRRIRPSLSVRWDAVAEVCRICRIKAKLSYEHVPPRAAFNDEPTTVYRFDDWLNCSEEGTLPGGRIEQRGAGAHTLCERCNNNTGSWYGTELKRAANTGAKLLMEMPLKELDRLLEHRWAQVPLKQSETGPHPLRFIKQIVTMLLATSPPELTLNHPEIGDFVLDRTRTGLSDRYRFYLALYAGPYARTTGVVPAFDWKRDRQDTFVEVAWPPYAYVMTIDSDPDAVETVDITPMADIGYNQRADIDLELLVGFGHTAIPVDYRTSAMIERDRALNEADAGEAEGNGEERGLSDWMEAQSSNPLIGEGKDGVFLTGGRLP
jgi:hypothetical protein